MENKDEEKMFKVFQELEKEGVTPASYQHMDPEGLGDTLKNIFEKIGVTEALVQKVFMSKSCNCDARRKFLNKVVPYWWKKKNPE